MSLISIKFIGDEKMKYAEFKGMRFDSIEEAAEKMKITPKTVYTMIKDGRMKQKRKETVAVRTWNEIMDLKSEIKELKKMIAKIYLEAKI